MTDPTQPANPRPGRPSDIGHPDQPPTEPAAEPVAEPAAEPVADRGVSPDVEVLPSGWRRAWTPVGAEHLREQYRRVEDLIGPYDQPRVREDLAEIFTDLSWVTPGTPVAMSAGLLLNDILPHLPFTGIISLAVDGIAHVPEDGDLSDFPVIGIDAQVIDARQRLYLLDLGDRAIPLALDMPPRPRPESGPATPGEPGPHGTPAEPATLPTTSTNTNPGSDTDRQDAPTGPGVGLGVQVWSYLELGTHQLPRQEMEQLASAPLSVCAHPAGAWVLVPEDEVPEEADQVDDQRDDEVDNGVDEVAAWEGFPHRREVLRVARSQGARWVNFDRDSGETLPGLPTFDW